MNKPTNKPNKTPPERHAQDSAPMPLNEARAQDAHNLDTVPVQGDEAREAPLPPDENFLCRTVPCRQKPARAFLEGKAPGVMQRYAPDAKTSDVEGWVEDDETVERLAKWREEAPYG